MKKLYLLILISFFLSSCDPTGCLDVEIMNNTNQDIVLNWYSQIPELNISKEFKQKEKLTIEEYSFCNVGGTVSFSLSEIDSIEVKSLQNEVLKTWKPNSGGKNIFNLDTDWEIQVLGKWDENYLFVINESDLN